MISRAALKQKAKDTLKGNWGKSILVYFVFSSIMLTLSLFAMLPLFGIIISFFIPTLVLGLFSYYLKLSRNENALIEDLFSKSAFFVKAFLLAFLMNLFILLWTILLIIPGIIAFYSYSQAYYILIDNPEMSSLDAIKASKELMKGHKFELFVLQLSFIGWSILCVFTLGIGYLWLIPYINTTLANFYNEISGKNIIFTTTTYYPDSREN